MRMGWGVGVNDVEAVLRSLPSLPLRYAAQDAAGRAAGAVVAAAAAGQPGAAPGAAGLARPRALGRALHAAAGLFSVVFDERFTPQQGRRLRRRAATVQARLFVGRAGEPGGALRRGDRSAARSRPGAARWCASRSAWKTCATCKPTWRRRCTPPSTRAERQFGKARERPGHGMLHAGLLTRAVLPYAQAVVTHNTGAEETR